MPTKCIRLRYSIDTVSTTVRNSRTMKANSTCSGKVLAPWPNLCLKRSSSMTHRSSNHYSWTNTLSTPSNECNFSTTRRHLVTLHQISSLTCLSSCMGRYSYAQPRNSMPRVYSSPVTTNASCKFQCQEKMQPLCLNTLLTKVRKYHFWMCAMKTWQDILAEKSKGSSQAMTDLWRSTAKTTPEARLTFHSTLTRSFQTHTSCSS